jgi:uncharacterized tellurite resistance protein B-like protein
MLQHSRFSGDTGLLRSIRADETLNARLTDAGALHHQNSVRMHLLASAVRVDLKLLPDVAKSLSELQSRAQLDSPMEAYVFDESSINAFVTKGRSQVIVALSSGAVNNLTQQELEFIIGHELGHALFGHLDVATNYILEKGNIEPQAAMQLLAWQRAAEISADRAGLICCNSLNIGATALFKTLSGLNIEGLAIDPREFAKQWECLETEVIEGGKSDDYWQLSHPFPPLRMKAMLLFWESRLRMKKKESTEEKKKINEEAEKEVLRLLAMMDPLARESKGSADPLLAEYFLWGGFYIALANGELHPNEIEQLKAITSKSQLKEAIKNGTPTAETCLQNFRACLERRHKRLKALEIHRIIEGLFQIAMADGSVDDAEIRAMYQLAGILGIKPNACDLIMSQLR